MTMGVIEGIPPDPILERREMVQRVARKTLDRRILISRGMVGLCGVALLLALVPLFAILYSLLQKGIRWWNLDFFTKVPQFPSLIDPNAIGGVSNAIIGSLVIDGIAALLRSRSASLPACSWRSRARSSRACCERRPRS